MILVLSLPRWTLSYCWTISQVLSLAFVFLYFVFRGITYHGRLAPVGARGLLPFPTLPPFLDQTTSIVS